MKIGEALIKVVDNRGKTPPWGKEGYELIETTSLVGDNKYPDFLQIGKWVSEETYNKWFRACHPKKDDVLIATVGANIGSVAIMKEARGCIVQNLVALRTNEKILNAHYLYYILSWERTQRYLKKLDIGAAQPSIKVPHLLDLDIPLLPFPTQCKIVAILSAYDDLIENNTRRIQILEEMAQLIYRQWFVEFKFPGHEGVRMVDSGTELGEVPEGWEVRKLGDLAESVRRNIKPGELGKETPYIGLEHMPRKSIALSQWDVVNDVGSTKLVFNRGEILFGKIRPYFHKVGVAPVDGIGSSDIIVIRPRKPEFFGLVLAVVSSKRFVEHSTLTSQGTKMPRANWDVLVEYPIVFTNESLVKRYNTIIQDIVELTNNYIFKNVYLRMTRDLLLPKLVSGEVEVDEVEV